MASRAVNFNLNIGEVDDADSVVVNVLSLDSSIPVDSQVVALNNGIASVAFSDARASLWPIPCQVRVDVSRAADGQTESVLVPINDDTNLTPSNVVISNVRVTSVTNTSAIVRCESSTPLAAYCEWGLDEDSRDNLIEVALPKTVHEFALTNLPVGTEIDALLGFPGIRTAQVPLFTTNSSAGGLTFAVVDDGATLTSSTHTVVWTESDSDPDDRYDLLINSVDQGPSVDANTRQITATTFGTTGSIQNCELHRINNVKPERNEILRFTYTAVDNTVTTGAFFFVTQPSATVTGQSSVRIRYELSQNSETWIELAEPAGQFVRVDEVNNLNDAMHVREIRNLRPSTTYTAAVYGRAQDGSVVQANALTFTTDAAGSTTGMRSSTFAQIAAGGLPFAVYEDPDRELEKLQWMAEFVRQNKDVVRYCAVDMAARTVTQLPTPTAPANAIQLPGPSGGNDTSIIHNLLEEDGDYVGTNEQYKFTRLVIDKKRIRIWDMPYLSGNNSPGIDIRTEDTLLVNCPAGGTKESTYAINLRNTAKRTHIIDCGYSDVISTSSSKGGDKSVIGVVNNGAQDTYIAGGVYRNLINLRGDSHTHRANAFWFHGSDGDYESPSAMILACYFENFESNGKLVDSEIFTYQGHIVKRRNTLQSIKIMGCESHAAGKRGWKCQDPGVIVLSNEITWDGRPTEAGRSNGRFQLNIMSMQSDGTTDLIGRHNRVRILGSEQFGWVINLRPLASNRRLENLHWDRNHTYIEETPTSIYDHFYSRYRPYNTGSYTEVNCSIRDNVTEGPGGFRANFHSYSPVSFARLGIDTNAFNQTGNSSGHRDVSSQ